MIYKEKIHYLLCITNLLLVITLGHVYIKPNKVFVEYFLSILLVLVIICSQLFWSNPVRYSLCHIVDSTIAKITMITFIGYTLFYKSCSISSTHIIQYIILVFLTLSSLVFSHIYSSHDWCCFRHIFFHAIAHIMGFASTLYAFL